MSTEQYEKPSDTLATPILRHPNGFVIDYQAKRCIGSNDSAICPVVLHAMRNNVTKVMQSDLKTGLRPPTQLLDHLLRWRHFLMRQGVTFKVMYESDFVSTLT